MKTDERVEMLLMLNKDLQEQINALHEKVFEKEHELKNAKKALGALQAIIRETVDDR